MSFAAVPFHMHVPEIDLGQLYGGQKRWRQVRGAELVVATLKATEEKEKKEAD
jgi:hypothetical protein